MEGFTNKCDDGNQPSLSGELRSVEVVQRWKKEENYFTFSRVKISPSEK